MTREQTPLEPDTKDWTWVLGRPCDECGFDASAYDRAAIPRAFRKNAHVWFALLADPAAGERSRPDRDLVPLLAARFEPTNVDAPRGLSALNAVSSAYWTAVRRFV